MTKTLSVNALENGTVIDHIPAGQAIRVLHLLALNHSQHPITLGLNLISACMGRKDIIKLTDQSLTPVQIADIGVFAPRATVNLIQDFNVFEKIQVHIPATIKGVLTCPNVGCITRKDPIKSWFSVQEKHEQISLCCHYCEHVFACAHLEGLMQ